MTFTTAAFDRSSSWRFKPSPTGRLRRVLLHLSYSMALSHLLDTTPPSLLTIAACRGLRPRLTAGLEGPALISRTAPHLLLQKRVRDTPSRCHLSPRRGARRRIRLANSRPNLRAHCRTVSWLTMMPRPASNSSTMRRPSGKRKYSHTAWLITSAGNRYPVQRARAGVVIPPDYFTPTPRRKRGSAPQVDGAVRGALASPARPSPASLRSAPSPAMPERGSRAPSSSPAPRERGDQARSAWWVRVADME